MNNKVLLAIAAVCAAVGAAPVSAEMRITEWMYSGTEGEFVEFTNLGASAIDMTGWSYDDDSRVAGTFDLSGFGVVNPGESVVITESDAGLFRTAWSLGASVKVLGGYTNNLGRNDEINLFDASSLLVDRLTYGDQNFPGTIRTQNVSGIPGVPAAIGANDPALWVLSQVGDGRGSFASANGDIGSPGTYIAPVPEPSTYALMLAGLGLVGFLARKRQR